MQSGYWSKLAGFITRVVISKQVVKEICKSSISGRASTKLAGGLKHNPLPSLPPTFMGGARVRNVCGITVILYERYTVSKTGSKEIWKSDLTPIATGPNL